MISRLAVLKPIAQLFWSSRRTMLCVGAALAATTVMAGIGLLGVSGWFITATAIAGLAPATAYAFDVLRHQRQSGCLRCLGPPHDMASV